MIGRVALPESDQEPHYDCRTSGIRMQYLL